MPADRQPAEIFCSYAPEDEYWQKKLKTHLSILQRQNHISFWYDRLIQPGADWEQEIDAHLKSASIILLLISADFFASDYCYGVEMRYALQRHETGEARVIPILLRPVDFWQSESLARLQALPTNARFLTEWGEGHEDAALADVAAGIRRALEDLSAQPASALHFPLPTLWNIPYPRNPFFLGRQELLSLLHRRFRDGQHAVLSHAQALSGLGGVGKTQIAVEYAYRYRQEYQAVLWARADTREELTSSYMGLALLLGLPTKHEQEQQRVIEAVKHWLELHERWLLILDNADDLTVLPEFLPTAPGGHLLFTTRAPASQGLAYRLEVRPFLPEQGALFLLRRTALIAPGASFEMASSTDCALALQITQELGGLPLALDQAGAYLEETGESLAVYVQFYEHEHTRLLQQRRGLLIGDHPRPVTTTWSLSFARIEKRNPAAADLLRFCAFLAPDHIPEDLFTQGAFYLGPRLAKAANPFFLGQAIETARAYSLIARDPTTRTLLMHRLVQAVLRDGMPARQAKQWRLRALQSVNAAFPKVEFVYWSRCEDYLPHALVCVRWAEPGSEGAQAMVQLLNKIGFYLTERIRYAEAEPLLQRALDIGQRQLGPDHPDTALSLNNLAGLYREQGHYREAEPLYQRALAIHEKQLGLEHPTTTSSLNNLALLYANQGRYREAEPLYQRTLALCEKQFGAEHLDTLISLNNLALLFAIQGRYREAEPLYQRVLALREKQLGADHPSTATSLHNLAFLYKNQRRYREAEPLYQRALAIREKQLGPDHPDTATSLNNLALLYAIQNRYGEAELLYQRALAINEKQLGAEHPSTASNLNNLALLYANQGRSQEAEPLYQRALALREKHLGADHPSTATSLNNLAGLYVDQGRYGEAEPLYQRALAIREKQLGADHPSTATSLNNLALLYKNQGRYEEAEPLHQRALAIREKQLGIEHPDTMSSLNNLAGLYEDEGRYGDAASLYQRALALREKQEGVRPSQAAQIQANYRAFLQYLQQDKTSLRHPK